MKRLLFVLILFGIACLAHGQQSINLGTAPAGTDGDTNRTAFGKVNTNFTTIFGRTLTIAGTANEITLSAGAQTLAADRTWTISLPTALTFTGKTITGGTYASPVLSGTVTGTYTLGGTPTFPAGVTLDTEWDTIAEIETATTADIIISSELTAFTGSANIVTVGTIGTGTWNADVIAPGKLGTGTSITTKYLRGDGTWQTLATGTGSMTTIKLNGSQVGDADMVTLDFSSDFGVSETPDTEANVTIASGITRDTEWDTEGEVQTAWGSVNILLETEIDASSELIALMDDETGTGLLVFATSPTLTTPTINDGTLDLDGGTLEIPNAAAPTTSVFGQIAGDNNAWAASRGAVQWFDGTANTFLVGALTTDTPSNGQVPKWNTGGTITWEDDSSGGTTAWDAIGDPSGAGTIAFGGTEQDITSTIDGGDILTITNTDADAASDSTFIKLAHNDGADANVIFLHAISDADGTPTDIFKLTETALTINVATTATTVNTTTFQIGGVSITADAAELNYTDGVTSAIQTQLDAKAPLATPDFTGNIGYANGTSDATLSAAGDSHLNTTDEQLSFHSAADGEISGEVALPLIQHRSWSFDPDAVCDGAVDRLFLFTVGDQAPEGIKIVEWKVSFEADPTTEADLDLKSADAFIGVANAAVLDVLDTTAGVSSEDTNANINSGNAIANGKVLYLEFGTAYTESNHQIIFEMWFYAEED